VYELRTASVVIFYSFIEALLAKLSIALCDKGRFCIPGLVAIFRQENAVGKVFSSLFGYPVTVQVFLNMKVPYVSTGTVILFDEEIANFYWYSGNALTCPASCCLFFLHI
jgi:hypothetical protein